MDFEVGSQVLLKRPFKTGALKRLYDGPYMVLEKLSELNYKLGATDGTPLAFSNIVHVHRLKPYYAAVDWRKGERVVIADESTPPSSAPSSKFNIASESEDDESSEESWDLDPQVNEDPLINDAPRALDEDDLERIQVHEEHVEQEKEEWIPPEDLKNVARIREELAKHKITIPSGSSRNDIRLTYETAYKQYRDFQAINILALQVSKLEGEGAVSYEHQLLHPAVSAQESI